MTKSTQAYTQSAIDTQDFNFLKSSSTVIKDSVTGDKWGKWDSSLGSCLLFVTR